MSGCVEWFWSCGSTLTCLSWLVRLFASGDLDVLACVDDWEGHEGLQSQPCDDSEAGLSVIAAKCNRKQRIETRDNFGPHHVPSRRTPVAQAILPIP